MSTLRDGAPLPQNPFPVIALRSGVVFPGTTLTLTVGRPSSIALIRRLHIGDVIGVATQHSANTVEPHASDLYRTGSFAKVVQIVRQSDTRFQVALEGLGRASFSEFVEDGPFLRANGELLPEVHGDTPEAELWAEQLREKVGQTLNHAGGALEEHNLKALSPSEAADRVASVLPIETEQTVAVLAEARVPERVQKVLSLLNEAQVRSELKAKIEKDVREQFGKHQRDAVLREQLKAIKKELGEKEGDDVEALRQKFEAKNPPAEIKEAFEKELGRLDSAQGPEAGVIRNYLDWLSELPWNVRAETQDDLDALSAQLDRDHTGLEDVKKRILEHMAVLKLSGNKKGTILCLVGPPGVGKTSLGESIAEATGRPFARVALGGVRDEAEIRGHRRTYVGALPGRLIHALRKVKAKNPVILLDEIDKLSAGYSGSPEAALLEVLDPEQNHTFSDHYVELPFDLSEVLFVCTANTLETIAAPLRDRLEIVELNGYTPEEKRQIARKHLISKRITESGVPENTLLITDGALDAIITRYTREAGVRQLSRELMRLIRSVALQVARHHGDEPLKLTVDADQVKEYLGKARFETELSEGPQTPGIATGLAWTPFGGDILFIETSKMPGKGRVEITGQLGDVMKESARAALSFVKSHTDSLGISADAVDQFDLHIHVPAGGVPKDGPSAGVTIFTALVSLLTDRLVRSDTAMTGECTLRGRVLPVGGIKAKVLAAHRSGLRRVILPKKNARDLEDLPPTILAEMEVILAEDMTEVLAAALEATPHSGKPLRAPEAAPPETPMADIGA